MPPGGVPSRDLSVSAIRPESVGVSSSDAGHPEPSVVVRLYDGEGVDPSAGHPGRGREEKYMSEDELLEEVHERVAQDMLRSMSPEERARITRLPMVFHEKVDELLRTPKGQRIAEATRAAILSEARGPIADASETSPEGEQHRADDYGPNTAQIRALHGWIATLDDDGWTGLVLASMMLTADPDIASPEHRAWAANVRHAVNTASEVTNRVRTNAMKAGIWPEIAASLVATSTAHLGLAMEAAKRLNPNATPEEVAAAVSTYSEPISGLTHALRLRPYVTEDEFTLLWGLYEMSEPRLSGIRSRLPSLERSKDARYLGATAQSGGCVVPVAAAILALLAQLSP